MMSTPVPRGETSVTATATRSSSRPSRTWCPPAQSFKEHANARRPWNPKPGDPVAADDERRVAVNPEFRACTHAPGSWLSASL